MAKIAIIGGGAAGMMAALQASANQHEIFLIEKNETLGRKLAATGSGRGNLTNMAVSADRYTAKPESFVQTVLEQLSPLQLIDKLNLIGIPTYATDDGWVYPVSHSAANVSDLLESHLRLKGIQLLLSHTVRDIQSNQGKFSLYFSDNQPPLQVDRVLITTGGQAAPQLGADMHILEPLMRLGYDADPVNPALAPMVKKARSTKKIEGVRMDLTVALYNGKVRIGRNTGNAIFTEWGLNGPAAMNLSHLIQDPEHNDYSISIDFLPNRSKYLRNLIQEYQTTEIPFFTLLKSVLPQKVARWALDKMEIPLTMPIKKVNRTLIENTMSFLTSFRLPLEGTRDFQFSQLSTGGINLDQINPHTMESKLHPNLYFAGEILNVIGPCGGYNLHWAFTTGIIAGSHIFGE